MPPIIPAQKKRRITVMLEVLQGGLYGGTSKLQILQAVFEVFASQWAHYMFVHRCVRANAGGISRSSLTFDEFGPGWQTHANSQDAHSFVSSTLDT